jgi:hypothetical protein
MVEKTETRRRKILTKLATETLRVLFILWGLLTSDTTKKWAKNIGLAIYNGISWFAASIIAIIFSRAPWLRDIVKTGIIGGWRQFRSHYNRNGANMVRSTRSSLWPLGWVCGTVSVVALFIQPLLGGALVLGTYIVFFQDADSLSLSTFSADSAGVNGHIGIGTSLIVNVFKLIGSARAAKNWVQANL